MTQDNDWNTKPVIEGSLALTHQQQQRFNTHGNLACYYWLNLKSLAEAEARQKIQQLMAEHHILRTRFIEPQGFTSLRQSIEAPILHWQTLPVCSDEWCSRQWQADKKNIETAALKNYSLKQAHLSASYLSTEATNDNYLFLIGSSLALDNGSALRICQYLTEEAIDTVEMQYSDYGEWVSELQRDEDAEEAAHYWHSFDFGKFAPLILSENNNSANTQASHKQSVRCQLPATICQQLHKTSAELSTTPALIGAAVWAALLSRLSGLQNFYLDYYHDAREDYPELDNVLGVFAQALPIPFYAIDSHNLEQCVSGLSSLIEGHIEYQEYLGSIALENRVGFHYSQQQAELIQTNTNAHYSSDLLLHCSTTYCQEKTLTAGELQLHYDASLYTKAAIERALQHYCLLLEQVLVKPSQALQTLACLLKDEQRQNTLPKRDEHSLSTEIEHQKSDTLLQGICQHVVKTPTAIAIRYQQTVYSYQELWTLSDRVAGNLQQLGAGPETIVALCLPRSGEFLVALVAVLKTGAAYLPIDSALPALRKAHIIDDAKPIVTIVYQQKGQESQVTELTPWSELINNSAALATVDINEQQLAYVLYTSGSSGLPKGVQVSHRAIMHYSLSAIAALSLPKHGQYGLISSLMADLGNTVLFPAWLQGGTLHLLAQELATDGQLFAEYHRQFAIDCLKIVPSHFSALLNGNNADLLPKHSLIFGGEKIDATLLKTLYQYQQKNRRQCQIYNHYGPTEATVGVLWARVDLQPEASTAPLRDCLGKNQAYLLDRQLNPAITGQVAELYIAGPSVTRGYLNNSAKTAEHYLPNPLGQHGQVMYRTGDLAMRSADNRLHIMGRCDTQIKIRGFRLDLGEIETLLAQYPEVERASIQVEGYGEQARLVGFYIPKQGQGIDAASLLSHLSQQLPEYMLPYQLWSIDALPLNDNGKLDTHALLEWAAEQKNKHYIAPQNTIERTISHIWQDILEIDKVSMDDNFFDIGGHSLAAIKVVARLRESLGRELPTNLIFQAQTIQQLASFIENNTELTHLQKISAPLSAQTQHAEIPTLVLMHTHGGHLNYYQPIINALKDDINIFGLYPDNKLLLTAGPEQLDELLAHYQQHLLPLKATPITLLGWSLAARQIVVLAEYLLKQGFTIKALKLIDYNPHEQLDNNDDEITQLIDDVQYYVSEHDNSDQHISHPSHHKEPFNSSTWASLKASLANHAIKDYQQGLEFLLDSGQLDGIIGNGAEGKIPTQWINERVGQKWTLK